MCYACKRCNRCGKFDKDNVLYVEPARPRCFDCGGELDIVSGKCTSCGKQVIAPLPPKRERHDR